MVVQEEEKTVGHTGDEGDCHQYIEGKKRKEKYRYKHPTWQWMMFADGPQWRRSTLALLQQPQTIHILTLLFFFFLFFSWKYLAQANSLSLYVFPSNIDQHLAKYTYTSVLYGWKWRKKDVWWSVVPRISSLVSSFKSTDAFIHKLLPCSVFSFLTI